MSVISIGSKRELLIIGAGGFGAVAACTAESMNAALLRHGVAPPWEVIGYADGDAAKHGTRHAGRTVHGTIEDVGRKFQGHELWFFCAIGDNRARTEMIRCARKSGWKPATLVHPSAVLDNTVEIGAGSYIGPQVVICFHTRVDAYVVVDSHVSIGHDAVLMDFCMVFSGARINGESRLGQSAMVGCNATLLPGTVVGDRAVVGANSLAHGLVEPDTTIFGVPGRVIRRSTNLFSAQVPAGIAKEAD